MTSNLSFALTLGIVTLVSSCDSSPEATEEQRSALRRCESSSAVGCCKRLHHHPGRYGRCVVEAAHGRGPCGQKTDAGRDTSAPDLDARADGPADQDAGADGSSSASCNTASTDDVWTSETVPYPAMIIGVFARAPDDAWLTMGNEVRHWNGMSWTKAFESSQACTAFTDVWAAGPQDVWAAGCVTAHWDGSTLTPREPPPPWYGAKAIRGLASDDVWMLGYTQIAHWDGAGWTVTATPSYIGSLWPVSANDVWMAGSGDQVFHWDGMSWMNLATGLPPDGVAGMWGSSASDIWMATIGGLNHYDGVGWSRTTRTLQTGSYSGAIIWGSCANDVWMSLTEPGHVAHFDGLKWSRMLVPSFSNMTAISSSGPDDVWIVGGFTNLQHRHVGPPEVECGNFRVDPGETCDPPDGQTCTAACQRIPGCGDGVIAPGEECDPPEPYVCSPTCKLFPTCGNSLLDLGETCDPPYHTSNFPYWCDSTCQKQVDSCSPPGAFCDSVVPCCAGSCVGFCR